MARLLIVDDNEQNRYMLEVLLKGYGYQVESTTNGAEALEAARRDPPDMIVTDILMPVMDGFTLCRRWKEDEHLKQIPFVFYTATYTDPKDEEFALSLGAERFIIKPVEPNAFVEILQEVIQAHQAGRLAVSRGTVTDQVYIREYNETLVRKLEEKVRELEQEASRRAQAEKELVREAAVNAMMAELSQALIAQTSMEDISNLILDRAKEFTGSEFGYVGYIDPQTGYLVSSTLTKDVWDVCQVPDKDIVFKEFRGLWGWVLENHKPLVTNSPGDDPRSSGTPTGHVPIRQVLSVPVLSGELLLGQLTLANPGRDYTERDLALAERLAAVYALAVQRRRAEEERARLLAQIQEQAQQVRRIVDTVPEGVLLLDAENRMILANPAALKDLEILTNAHIGDVLVSLGERLLSELVTWPQDTLWHELEAGGRIFEIIARPVPIASRSTGQVLVIRDMTHEHEMQHRMRQQDRLTVIGQLAGGVAHDFNNLLTAIRGYTQFALDKLDPSDPVCTDLEEVEKAAGRAAALTNQLLIFSRKQVLQPQVLNLNAVATNMEKMLHRLIGEDIELHTDLDPALGQVKADPGQIEQVIMNLAVNARDAMPGGGRLTLKTENVAPHEIGFRENPSGSARTYVMLAVSDTGAGMSEEVKAHLFEPFFTTKEQGKGTGLGLVTIYGIVERSGGHIEVDSEVGKGTTFKIYLPRTEERIEGVEPGRSSSTLPRGTETILLVEDEELVRKLARRILEACGYVVLEADHPQSALLSSARYDGPIHLLVTDVVMPGMGGRELFERLAALHRETQVLYISGYTDDTIAHSGMLDPGVALLQKPFSPDALAHKVRKVLEK